MFVSVMYFTYLYLNCLAWVFCRSVLTVVAEYWHDSTAWNKLWWLKPCGTVECLVSSYSCAKAFKSVTSGLGNHSVPLCTHIIHLYSLWLGGSGLCVLCQKGLHHGLHHTVEEESWLLHSPRISTELTLVLLSKSHSWLGIVNSKLIVPWITLGLLLFRERHFTDTECFAAIYFSITH